MFKTIAEYEKIRFMLETENIRLKERLEDLLEVVDKLEDDNHYLKDRVDILEWNLEAAQDEIDTLEDKNDELKEQLAEVLLGKEWY